MEQTVNRLPYWNSLNENEKEAVRKAAVLREYEKGHILQGNCEDACDNLGMIYVCTGEVRACMISDEGREITLFRIKSGESCVLAATCLLAQISSETQLVISEDAKILIIPGPTFEKLSENNVYVRCFMYELATMRFSSVVRVMEQMLFKHFDQRLAEFFLNEYRKTGNPEIRMTQEQIAQNVNSAREVVARMIKRFASDNLIEIHRGRIILKDIRGLEDII